MTDLPVWLQEIRDRAEEAQGPWWVTIARGASGRLMYEVTTAPWKHAPNVFPLSPASMEKLVSHPYVPRLVELVGEMAWNLRNVTDQVQDACRSRMTPLSQCPEPSDDYCPTCPTGLRGECGAPRSLEALRKFRGEVSSND
jgi:hypothetical protein